VKDIAGNNLVVITGDFNSKPSDDPIKIITESTDKDKFIDTKAVSLTPHYGPQGTFNAFTPKEIDNEPIDFIFLKGKWKVLQHATLSQTWGGRFSSDHFPVFAKLSF
jgi:endonuclease/exonuclease/phosphatase family metal-dependent hydrolase